MKRRGKLIVFGFEERDSDLHRFRDELFTETTAFGMFTIASPIYQNIESMVERSQFIRRTSNTEPPSSSVCLPSKVINLGIFSLGLGWACVRW
jgi:hypothetical protein